MVISHKYKFLYLQTKKTASISISLALGQIADPNTDIIYYFNQWSDLQKSLGIQANAWKKVNKNKKSDIKYKVNAHAKWKKLFRFIRDNKQNYFKFTVERNPWDKVVSLYHYFLNSGFNKEKQNKVKNLGFNRYIKKTNLWKTCYNWPFYTNNDKIVLDYICKYENLMQDLQYVESRIGVPFVHLVENKANAKFRKKKNYRDFYIDETKEIIRNHFKKEIDYFEYEF